jgi:hypothetical protein
VGGSWSGTGCCSITPVTKLKARSHIITASPAHPTLYKTPVPIPSFTLPQYIQYIDKKLIFSCEMQYIKMMFSPMLKGPRAEITSSLQRVGKPQLFLAYWVFDFNAKTLIFANIIMILFQLSPCVFHPKSIIKVGKSQDIF